MHTSHRTNRNTVVAWVSVIALACAYSAGCATGEDSSEEQPNATGGAAGEGGEAGATGDASVGGAAGASGKGGAAGSSGQAGASGEAGSAGAQGGAAGEGGSNAGGSSAGGSGTGGSNAGGSSTGGSSTGGSSTGGSSTGGSSTGGSSTGGAAGSVQMPVGCAIPGFTYDCVPSTNQGCNTASDEACDYDSNSGSFVCYTAEDPWWNDAALGQACDIDNGPTCKPTMFCSTDDANSSSGVCVKYCCSNSDCSGTTKCLGFDPGNGTLGGCYDSSTGGTGGTGGSSGAGGSGTGGSGTGGSGTGGSAGSGGAGGASGTGGSAGSGGAIDDAGTDVSTGGSTGQGGSTGEGGVPSLYFSEYLEGGSNNKALEIYNAGSSEYDLSTCIVRRYQNGASDPNAQPALSIPAGTMLAAGDVFVLCNTLAAQGILDVCDLKNANVNFNGNDAVELVCDSVTVDVFGRIGEDPGTAWGTAPTSTADTTLVRKCTVTQGDTNGTDAFDPSVEWDGYAKDTFTNLGSRNCP